MPPTVLSIGGMDAVYPPPLAIAAAVGHLIDCDPRWRAVHAVTGDPPPRRIKPDFEGLVSIILSQQVSVAAARTIEARLRAALGGVDVERIGAADEALLRRVGLPGPKIRALRALANAIREGVLDPVALTDLPDMEVVTRLTGVSGIGRWSAEIFLLFALERADAFPAGDLAVREAARDAFDLSGRPSPAVLLAMSENWRPWRSVAARLLFAYYAALKKGRSAPSSEERAP